MNEREMTASGSFYPQEKKELEKKVSGLLKAAKAGKADACICPHAGYEYSGKPMAKAIKSTREAQTIVLLCPNHTGLGSPYAVSLSDWKTPLGAISTNKALAEQIATRAGFEFDDVAHMHEHSAEVILPFLQAARKKKEFSMAVVCLSGHNLEKMLGLGKALHSLKKQFDFALVASSDFSHYAPAKSAEERDKRAIERIMKLDAKGFFGLVEEERLSICGYLAITAATEFARLGKLKPRLLEYTHSGKATGDNASVVGYGAIAFE